MRHNQVYLCGVIQDAPKIRKQSDKQLAEFRLITITGRRSGGLQLNSGEYDTPLIVATDPERVAEIEKIQVGDIVTVKGAITTTKVFKTPRCPNCGQPQRIPGMLTYISPSCVTVSSPKACIGQYGVFDKNIAVAKLKEIKEISNYATVLGVVCTPPKPYKSEGDKKRRIVSYQLATKRKFRVIGNLEDATVDFPWVKSYGKIGINDARYINKGTYVFVDGWVRARKFERPATCEHCGSNFYWTDVTQELVSYATEYLKNYNEVSHDEDSIRRDIEQIYKDRKTIINEADIEEDKIEETKAKEEAIEELKNLDAYLKELDAIEDENEETEEDDD